MMRSILIIIFCSFVTFAYADQEIKTTSVEKAVFESVIFPASYPIPWFNKLNDYLRCELTEVEAAKADAIFIDYMTIHRIDEFNPDLMNYRRQYFGLIRKFDGHTCVWINCFLNVREFNNWKKQLVEIKDGGSSFFNIKVDLDAGEAFDLAVNRES